MSLSLILLNRTYFYLSSVLTLNRNIYYTKNGVSLEITFINYHQLESKRNIKSQISLLKKATSSFISTKVKSGARRPFTILQCLLRKKHLFTQSFRAHIKNHNTLVTELPTHRIKNTFNLKNHCVQIKFDRKVPPALIDHRNIDH